MNETEFKFIAWVMNGRDDRDLPGLEDFLGRPAWHQRGLCAGMTPVFFSTAPGNLQRAKAICAVCPVQATCLAYAMSDPDLLGVFGGTTDRERREMRRGAVA